MLRQLARLSSTIEKTLAGRLLFEPFACVWRLLRQEGGRLLAGDARNLGSWAGHALGCALVFAWVVGVCGVPILEYLAFS